MDLEAHAGFYRPGLPKVKGVRIIAYSDENLRVAALQSGDVDLIEYVPQAMAGIEKDPAQARRRGRSVHVADLQRHPPPFTIRACARRWPMPSAAGNRQGRLLRPRRAFGAPAHRQASPLHNADLARRLGIQSDLSKKLLADAGFAAAVVQAPVHRAIRDAQDTRKWCSSISPPWASPPS